MNACHHNSNAETNSSSHRRALITLVAYTAFTLLLSVINMSFARAEPNSNLRVEEKLQATLQARVPEIKIESVRAAPMAGLYEVLTPSEIIYSDAKAELLFVGKIVDAQKRIDLTSQRWEETQRIDFNALPFDQAIKITQGDGSRSIAIFADPQCPFCERLEKALADMHDLTIYIFLLPIPELHPQAEGIAKNIWCGGSENRGKVWRDWMIDKKTPTQLSCKDEPVNAIKALAQQLKVSGTPTLFFSDGRRIAGALTAEQLEIALANRVAAQ